MLHIHTHIGIQIYIPFMCMDEHALIRIHIQKEIGFEAVSKLTFYQMTQEGMNK